MDDHACAGEHCRLCAWREGRPDPSGYVPTVKATAAEEERADAEWAAQRRAGRSARIGRRPSR